MFLSGSLFSINQRRIRAGTTTRNSGGLIMGIKSAQNHPTFGKNGHDGDITILYLESRFTFGDSIGAAFMPSQGLEMFDNAPVTHAGWGTTRVSLLILFADYRHKDQEAPYQMYH